MYGKFAEMVKLRLAQLHFFTQTFRMAWEVIPTNEAVHVVPLDDEGEHLLEDCCPCHPRRDKTKSGGLMLIHDAYDGRVAVECVNEIIG